MRPDPGRGDGGAGGRVCGGGTDSAGSVTSAVAVVTLVDTTGPEVAVWPTNQVLAAGAECQAVVPELTKAVVADDCSVPLTITQSRRRAVCWAWGRTR